MVYMLQSREILYNDLDAHIVEVLIVIHSKRVREKSSPVTKKQEQSHDKSEHKNKRSESLEDLREISELV